LASKELFSGLRILLLLEVSLYRPLGTVESEYPKTDPFLRLAVEQLCVSWDDDVFAYCWARDRARVLYCLPPSTSSSLALDRNCCGRLDLMEKHSRQNPHLLSIKQDLKVPAAATRCEWEKREGNGDSRFGGSSCHWFVYFIQALCSWCLRSAPFPSFFVAAGACVVGGSPLHQKQVGTLCLLEPIGGLGMCRYVHLHHHQKHQRIGSCHGDRFRRLFCRRMANLRILPRGKRRNKELATVRSMRFLRMRQGF